MSRRPPAAVKTSTTVAKASTAAKPAKDKSKPKVITPVKPKLAAVEDSTSPVPTSPIKSPGRRGKDKEGALELFGALASLTFSLSFLPAAVLLQDGLP